MALMDFSLDDLDGEISGDAQFLFPVVLPLIFAVHFEDNHFRQFGHRRIRPAVSDAFKPAADFSKHSFQKRYGFGSNDPGLEPYLDVSEQMLREVLNV